MKVGAIILALVVLACIVARALWQPAGYLAAPVTLSCPRGSALYSYTSTAWGPTLACRPPHLAPAGAVEVEPVQR